MEMMTMNVMPMNEVSMCMVSEWNYWRWSALSHLIICLPITLFLTYLICAFIKAFHAPKSHAEIMFIMVILFCASSLFQLANLLLGDILCIFRSNAMSRSIRSNIFLGLAFVQLYTLLFIFFMRFNVVLKGTNHRFSSCILYSYYFAFIITGIGGIVVSSLYMFLDKKVLFIPAAMSMLGVMVIISAMVVTFAYKLVTVYKTTDNDPHFISVITKIMLLTSISISISIIDGITIACRVYMFSPVMFTVYWYMATLDTFSNFLCLILSYKRFHDMYILLCGVADRKCNQRFMSKLNAERDMENTHGQQDKKISIFDLKVTKRDPERKHDMDFKDNGTSTNTPISNGSVHSVPSMLPISTNSGSVKSVSPAAYKSIAGIPLSTTVTPVEEDVTMDTKQRNYKLHKSEVNVDRDEMSQISRSSTELP